MLNSQRLGPARQLTHPDGRRSRDTAGALVSGSTPRCCGPTRPGRHDMDFKLELVIIPVADVDRAKDFYARKLGCQLEVDGQANKGGRIVQVTPPGSACSIGFGSGLRLDSRALVTAVR